MLTLQPDELLRTLPVNTGNPLSRRSEGTEEDAYVHLFPSGVGGEHDPQRSIPLSTADYSMIRLLAYPRFQADTSWAFRALNTRNQADAFGAIQFIQRQLRPSQDEGLTASQLLEMMSDKPSGEATATEIFSRYYPIIGRAIRGSQMYWRKVRQHLHRMYAALGHLIYL